MSDFRPEGSAAQLVSAELSGQAGNDWFRLQWLPVRQTLNALRVSNHGLRAESAPFFGLTPRKFAVRETFISFMTNIIVSVLTKEA